MIIRVLSKVKTIFIYNFDVYDQQKYIGALDKIKLSYLKHTH